MTTSLLFARATPLDVINHAYERYPHTLVAYLRGLGEQHALMGHSTHNRLARASAFKLSTSCVAGAKLLSERGLEAGPEIMKDIAIWIPVYQAACHVLEVPRLAQHDIVVRWEARDAAHQRSIDQGFHYDALPGVRARRS